MTVFLIGPESRVYHTNENCSALNISTRYWGIQSGTLLSNGTVQGHGLGRPFYEGRRPCKRCGNAKP